MAKKSTGKKPSKKQADKQPENISDLPEETGPLDGELVVLPDPEPEEHALDTVSNDTSIVAGVTTGQLKQALETQTEQRKLIKDFIQTHLVDGTDFGRIHFKKDCAYEKKEAGSCRIDSHHSKRVLYKPGQEKIFSLFSLTSQLKRDDETMEMLKETRNLVAYKCVAYRMVDGERAVVAEGRGAAVIGEKGRDVNATIKIAEKRARMDACLAMGFSEYFAQDLDDPDYQNQKRMSDERERSRINNGDDTPATPADKLPIREAGLPPDDTERTMLMRYMLHFGIDSDEEQIAIIKINGIPDPKNITSGQIRMLIRKMATKSFAIPQATTPKSPDDDISADGIKEALDAAQVPDEKPSEDIPEEAELVVDEEFKSNIIEWFNSVGFNKWGEGWFFKRISGRPFGRFDEMTDAAWAKAYQFLPMILNNKVPVDKNYLESPDGQIEAPLDFSEPSNAKTRDNERERPVRASKTAKKQGREMARAKVKV